MSIHNLLKYTAKCQFLPCLIMVKNPGQEAQLLLSYSASATHFYLRQVNEVNGGDNAFVRCVFVCQCVCLCVRSGRSWELNANSSKTVKATDLKFDARVPRDSPDMIPKNFSKRGVATVT